MIECRLCHKQEVEPLIDFGKQPIVHNLLDAPNLTYKKYSFKLGVCPSCGFLQLTDYIAPEILYENYFTVSGWKNQPHVQRLIEVIKHTTGLNENSKLVEIGCNDGCFLTSLKEDGIKNLTGIEPTKDASTIAINKGLDVHNTFFNQETAKNIFEKESFDVLVTRQVLEHIADLDDFMQSINFVLKEDGFLVIEIPDCDGNLEYLDYTLWEEHVNYFTIFTLKQLLARHGFSVIHHETTLFSGKALIAIAVKDKTSKSSAQALDFELMKVRKFQTQWTNFQAQLRQFLSEQNEVMIYGCGARSCNFINFTGVGDLIKCFVDDQEEKQQKYIPGCELKIEPYDPAFAKGHYLLGVNTENEFRVIKKRGFELSQCSSILPPSNLIPKFWKEMINA
jgi:2-polyprenyl-3-methyl-5-hydroxy-6-metoxy-1,4-benzoquinol methylase